MLIISEIATVEELRLNSSTRYSQLLNRRCQAKQLYADTSHVRKHPFRSRDELPQLHISLVLASARRWQNADRWMGQWLVSPERAS
ncbi:hypothetical protein V8C35DRAFT_311745 [Trichoderma chlorosporum]